MPLGENGAQGMMDQIRIKHHGQQKKRDCRKGAEHKLAKLLEDVH
jgi:hypothetical protein